ncbi:MAG: hypothetical protein GY847_06420, partial [Proteobacteria bacterium]|nr:hypothetical protein [Pseudomonadota bacterium]
QVQVQDEDDNADLQGEDIPPWSGYGRFSTVMGRHSKGEFQREFYARNACVTSARVMQRNLSAYQQLHVTHQRRRFARIVMYKQNRTVAEGSISHSLSKNQLEDVNRGPTGEIPERSQDGYSTDYDTEGDESMEQMLATMPPLPPQSQTPPTHDSDDETQPPDPFPSEEGIPPPPAFGAEQANTWRFPALGRPLLNEPHSQPPRPQGDVSRFECNPETGRVKVPPGEGWPIQMELPMVARIPDRSPRPARFWEEGMLYKDVDLLPINPAEKKPMTEENEVSDSDDELPGLTCIREEEVVKSPEHSAPLLPTKALLHNSDLSPSETAELKPWNTRPSGSLLSCFAEDRLSHLVPVSVIDEEEQKKEDKKKQGETHVGQIVAPDGQGKDADNKKGLDGDPSQPM